MKKQKFLYLLISLIASQSFCADGKFGFDIALDYQSYIYKEPSVMHIKGGMQGIVGSISYQLENYRHNLKTGFYGGNLTYSGAKYDFNLDSYQSHSARTKDRYYFAEYVAQLRLNTQIPLWFMGGLGYRSLDNKTFESYRRKQRYIYATLGLSGEHYFTDKTMFYINAYYRILILGKNTSYTTQIGLDKNLHFEQAKGQGALFEIGVKHQLPHFALSCEVYADYWNISESNSDYYHHIANAKHYYFVEPKNYTLAFGGRVKLSF